MSRLSREALVLALVLATSPSRAARGEVTLPTAAQLPPLAPPRPLAAEHPMAWGVLGGFLGGTVAPTVGNTLYLLDRNGPNWYASQKAIDDPELLLWANSWLYGSVGLLACPTTTTVFYLGSGGPASQAFGGWMYGLLTGIVALPVGGLLGAAAVKPMRGYAWSPTMVYGTYSAVTFLTMTTGSLVGYTIAGGRLSDRDIGARRHLRVTTGLLPSDRGYVGGAVAAGAF